MHTLFCNQYTVTLLHAEHVVLQTRGFSQTRKISSGNSLTTKN